MDFRGGIIVIVVSCLLNIWYSPLSCCTHTVVDKMNTGCHYEDHTLCISIGCYDYPTIVQIGPLRSSLLNTKVLPQYIVMKYYTGWFDPVDLNVSDAHHIVCIQQKLVQI